MNVWVSVVGTQHRYRIFLFFFLSLYSVDISSSITGYFCVYENVFSESFLLDRFYFVKY